MFNWFKKKGLDNYLSVDLHSHLIPGIDDGVKSMNESVHTIEKMVSLGFKKIITTPHILSGHYPNTPDIIRKGINEVRQELEVREITIEIEAAAEYYLDETFVKAVHQNEDILSFGTQKYVLVETGFLNKPLNTKEVFFELLTNGYKPILAHPERYTYVYEDYALVAELKEMGVLMQVNALSMIGHYGSKVESVTKNLIKDEFVDFIGSDIHHLGHAELYRKVVDSKLFQKCKQLELLNNTLL